MNVVPIANAVQPCFVAEASVKPEYLAPIEEGRTNTENEDRTFRYVLMVIFGILGFKLIVILISTVGIVLVVFLRFLIVYYLSQQTGP